MRWIELRTQNAVKITNSLILLECILKYDNTQSGTTTSYRNKDPIWQVPKQEQENHRP